LSDNRSIGVFDSGLGGLTVTKEIIKLLPNENIVYFGDTGRVPYGTKSAETIKKYALEDENFLLSKNVKMIVAACGTVSSVAYDTAKDLPVPFVEVISHSVLSAVKATKNKRIGVLATAATIKSHSHKNKILSLLPDAQVTEVIGTLLVPLVEEGFTSSDDVIVFESVKRYMKAFIDAEVDTVILGCTHFPVLIDTISKVLGERVTLINMGVATANAVKEELTKSDMLNTKGGAHDFYLSDKSPAFKKIASSLLGEEIDETKVETVEINKL